MKLETEKIPFFLGVWIVIAVVCTCMAGLAYATAQHVARSGANQDPLRAIHQIQDIVKQGVDPSQIIPASGQDIKDSYSVFAALFDDKGTVVSSSVQVDGKNPTLPSGVFDYAKQHGEDRFTWQPQNDVREAVVLVPYNSQIQTGTSTQASSGYILAGQSLTETEKTVRNIVELSGIAWIFSLVLTFLLCWGMFRNHNKHHHVQEIGETVV